MSYLKLLQSFTKLNKDLESVTAKKKQTTSHPATGTTRRYTLLHLLYTTDVPTSGVNLNRDGISQQEIVNYFGVKISNLNWRDHRKRTNFDLLSWTLGCTGGCHIQNIQKVQSKPLTLEKARSSSQFIEEESSSTPLHSKTEKAMTLRANWKVWWNCRPYFFTSVY